MSATTPPHSPPREAAAAAAAYAPSVPSPLNPETPCGPDHRRPRAGSCWSRKSSSPGLSPREFLMRKKADAAVLAHHRSLSLGAAIAASASASASSAAHAADQSCSSSSHDDGNCDCTLSPSRPPQRPPLRPAAAHGRGFGYHKPPGRRHYEWAEDEGYYYETDSDDVYDEGYEDSEDSDSDEYDDDDDEKRLGVRPVGGGGGGAPRHDEYDADWDLFGPDLEKQAFAVRIEKHNAVPDAAADRRRYYRRCWPGMLRVPMPTPVTVSRRAAVALGIAGALGIWVVLRCVGVWSSTP